MSSYDYSEYDPDNINNTSSPELEMSSNRAKRRSEQKNNSRRNSSQRSSKSEAERTWIDSILSFVKARRTRALIGISMILLSVWLSVAALSFFKSNKADQSAITSQTVEQLAENPDSVENITGPGGAVVSHHLFVEGLGVGSIVLIVYIVIVALGLLGVKKIRFWKLTSRSLILAITISMVLGFVFVNSDASIPPGGYHGKYLNVMLMSKFGWIGALLVNLALIATVVTIYLNELASLYQKYKIAIRTRRDRSIMEEDRKEFRRKEVENAMSQTPLDEDAPKQEEIMSPDSAPHALDLSMATLDASISSQDNKKDDLHISLDDEGDVIDANQKSDKDNSISGQISEPGFEMKETEDIEQGTGLPSKVAAQGPFDPKAELSGYRMPPISLMIDRPKKANSVDITEQEENKERIIKTLEQYKIRISKISVTVGPTITLYEIIPAEGVRIASIKNLEDDIAMSLAALGIRIIAPIPGRGTIGIEVPNKDPQTVSIRSILGSRAFQETKYELPMALGATIENNVYIADLTKMPHLLVAGATGQGKSVGLNAIIASLLYKKHPAELKFVLVDPKMVEFSLYACLEKHYLAKLPDEVEPVITDPNRVVDTLNSLCKMMDDRYARLKDAGCRNVIEYNNKIINRRLNPEKGHEYMPYIVMIVDEFADLIMMAGKAVETPIARIAQKARAVGMHMIIATQRPSTNVITGLIKANFPARIGFRVSQMVDSRTILDSPGANQLIGRGDMLISANGTMERVQCAFIDTPEVEALCNHIQNQIGYPHAYILPDPPTEMGDEISSMGGGSLTDRDPLLEEVGRWIVGGNTASTSSLQRRYSIGFNRAGKIMDQLESLGVVSAAQGGKPRQVLVDAMSIEDIFNNLR